MPYQMSLGRLEWMTELSPSNIAKAKVTINDRDADGFAHRKGDNSVDFDLSNGRGEHKVSLLLSRMQSVDVLVTDIAHPQWAIVTVADLRSGDRVRMATGDIGLVTSNENAPDQTVPRGRAIIIGTSERLTDTFLDVRTATDLVTTTPEHPFMVQGKGWIEAHKLQSGDVLDGSNGKSVEVASVALRKISPPQTVNNLETWPDHTFRVGKEGLLVHNGGCVTPPDVSKGKFALSEMKEWMSRWKMPDRQTLSEYIRDHAWRHGYPSQYGEYLRDAANFNKESAVLRELPDGALKWIRGNEFLIERDGKIVSFGLNPD